MSTYTGCFFLDSNIPISDILNEKNPRIEKLKNDSRINNICCYISDSVKQEITDKVTKTTDYLGNVVRQIIHLTLEESRRNRGIDLATPMTSEDIRVLEDLFASFHNVIRWSDASLLSPISAIEEWAISFLAEKFDQGISIDIHKFILELTMKLLKFSSDMQDIYDHLIEFEKGYIKTKTIVPDPQIVIALNNLGLHAPDDFHVASAYFYQTNNSENVVFVTFDYKTILQKRYSIWNMNILIKCSDPLYAIHHLS